jgi:hypothetical protein
VLGAISQAVSPLFFSTIRSLSWLIDNLVQKGQAQTSDILPLEKGDVASVAVILAVSSMWDSTDAEGDPALPVQGEGQDSPELSMQAPLPEDLEPVSAPSAVDRFLSNLDGSFAGLAMNTGEVAGRRTQLGADWVWQQAHESAFDVPDAIADRSTLDRAGAGRIHRSGSNLPEAEVADDLELMSQYETVRQDDQPAASAEQESPLTVRLTIPALVLVVSAVALAWQRYGNAIRAMVSKWRNRRAPKSVTRAEARAAGASRSLGQRSRSYQDLPPWMQNSPGKRTRSKSIYNSIFLSRKTTSR